MGKQLLAFAVVMGLACLLSCKKKDKCKVDIQIGQQLMLMPNTDGTSTQIWLPVYETIDTCKSNIN